MSSLYHKFKYNQRKYEQLIKEDEMASFTPLVFSTSGGMSGAMNVFYKQLAYLVSLKKADYCKLLCHSFIVAGVFPCCGQ